MEEARHQVAAALGADDKEIVFTSGATESDNLAVLGVARLLREKGRHVVTGQTEHRAVLDACQALEREGFEVTRLAPDGAGAISPEQVRRRSDGRDDPRVAHAREQRDRHDPSDFRDRRRLPRARRPLPHRRGSGIHEDPVRCCVGIRRSRLGHGAQALWPEGHGRALRAGPQPARASRADPPRRRPRARSSIGHLERPGHRGLRKGRRDRDGGAGDRSAPPAAPAPAAGRPRSASASTTRR